MKRVEANRSGRQFPSRLIGAGLTLMLCSLAVVAQEVTARKDTGTGKSYVIAGVIVNDLTGAPLEQARVTIQETKNRASVGAVFTGEDGRFAFTQLPAGKYSLQGVRRGFLPGYYEQHEQYSTAIVTGPEFQTENLVLRLTPMAMISGHISDESGDAVRSAQVRLYREEKSGGMSRIMGMDRHRAMTEGTMIFSCCDLAIIIYPRQRSRGTRYTQWGKAKAQPDRTITFPPL